MSGIGQHTGSGSEEKMGLRNEQISPLNVGEEQIPFTWLLAQLTDVLEWGRPILWIQEKASKQWKWRGKYNYESNGLQDFEGFQMLICTENGLGSVAQGCFKGEDIHYIIGLTSFMTISYAWYYHPAQDSEGGTHQSEIGRKRGMKAWWKMIHFWAHNIYSSLSHQTAWDVFESFYVGPSGPPDHQWNSC